MADGRIVFVTRLLTHYRVRFHELVREALAAQGLEYQLYHGDPTPAEAAKADLVSLDWATRVKTRYLGPYDCVWLDLPRFRPSDLVIVGQENRLLNNYPLQIARSFGGPRVAFFGHGRNFQSKAVDGPAERFKRFWIARVDWWFAYTDHSAEIVRQARFPASRVTVCNNAIDMAAIAQAMKDVSSDEAERLRAEMVGGSRNVGLFIGGLYPLKRLGFLVAAAHAIRRIVPDFHLIIVGGGVDREALQSSTQGLDWVHVMGPRFVRDNALYASLSKVFLMPGLVGLAVLDSFAYGLPMVTTKLAYHSPEIAYLKDGENGVIVPDSEDVDAYAAEVVRVLTAGPYRDRLVAGAVASRTAYTIEAMASRFAQGAIAALRHERLPG